MIHVLNNLPKEYNLIINGLEYCLIATWDNALTINSIYKKMIYRCKKLKVKKKKKGKSIECL